MLRNRKRHRPGLVLACAVVAATPVTQFAAANVITGTRDFEIVARLTGPQGSDAINPTWQVGVQGTDLGHMVNHNGKTYFLFGDTFDGPGNAGSGGPDWRNNVMAWSTDLNPADGITFDGWLTRANGTARQAIVPGFQPVTYIPTGAISVGDKIYAWYMHVSNWDTGWTLSHSGLAWWREGDSQFTTVPNFRFEAPGGGPYTTGHGAQGPGNFGMVAASYRSPLENANDDHIYIWGTPGGREGGVKLARVLPSEIENLSAYQFFNGEVDGVPQWADNEFVAQKIIPSGVGEMSVMYNEALGAWTLMYIRGGPFPDFHIRQADNPWGPWSEPTIVTRFDQAPGLYSPYMNPLYVEDGGETLYFTMSLWGPYDVYLAKVTLDIDLGTRWTAAFGNWAGVQYWSHGRPDAERRAILDNGGTLRLNTVASARMFDVGTGAGLGGTVEILPGAALTIHDGGFRLGQGQGSQAVLQMTGGSVAVLDPNRMFIVGDHGSATATVSGGSISAPTLSIAHQPTASGHMELKGGSVAVETVRIGQLGTLDLDGGTLAANTIQNTLGGTLSFTGGTLHVRRFEGSLTNTAGTLAPRRSAGATTIIGSYTQLADAKLEIEIGGLTAGSQHNRVNVTGAASLGGTIQLALLDGFVPDASHTFTVFSAAGLSGVFDNVASGERLDTMDGLGSFLVHYGASSAFNPNQIVLSGFALAALPGDFNGDGVVDAADYVVWRDGLGTMFTAAQYQLWKSNFGATAAAAASSSTTPVPEPASLALLTMSLLGSLLHWRRFTRNTNHH